MEILCKLVASLCPYLQCSLHGSHITSDLYLFDLILEYISCHLREINSPKLESGGMYEESMMNPYSKGIIRLFLSYHISSYTSFSTAT